MFSKKFFSNVGLSKFSINFSSNISHIAVNSELMSWITLKSALSGENSNRLNDILILGISKLYENPNEFETNWDCGNIPIEFQGLRDLFFTYFISRVPVMLYGTRLTWKKTKKPSNWEIRNICEYCVKSYSDNFQAMPCDFKSEWKEYYEKGLKFCKWWIPLAIRDKYFYNNNAVDDFLHESYLAWIEIKYPESLRIKSNNMQNLYSVDLERFRFYLSWFKENKHVFIDTLGKHLQLAYPIYSAF